MNSRKFLFWALLTTNLVASQAFTAAEELPEEAISASALIVNLAKSIAKDLNPPATGAERRVTNATITQTRNSTVYLIEGEDVYRNGRVLSTFWLRLTNSETGMNHGNEPSLKSERILADSTQEFIGALLNTIYDIEEMGLDHRRVLIERVTRSEDQAVVYEIYGENQVCEHRDLNRFKIIVTRNVDERNQTTYETELLHPHKEEACRSAVL